MIAGASRACFLVAAGILMLASQDSGAQGFDAVLRPVTDDTGQVTAIEVQALIRAELVADSGPLVLSVPIVYAGVPNIAARVQGLKVEDRNGAVPLLVEDEDPAPGGFPYYRRYKAEREVSLPVTFSYRSAVQPEGERNGPPFGIRSSAGGVSGTGSGFLVLPDNVSSSSSAVSWDLGELPGESVGITSFGEGSFELQGAPEMLRQGWIMAGPLERYPASGDLGGFSASWLGEPPFDATAAMTWSAEVFNYLGQFFGYLDPPPRYRVFMRALDTPPFGGGTALTNSFMLSRSSAQASDGPADIPRGTLVHELVHLWVGGIQGPVGVTSWFSEGLTTYYSSLLPFRGGFSSLEDFAESINVNARSYYTNPARNWTAARIANVGFGDSRVRHRPYELGALYFADLDAKIRDASAGERTLHDFMREVFSARENDPEFTFDHEKWIELVSAEIGPQAKAEFEDIVLGGETMVPSPGAYGPCLVRVPESFDEEGSTITGYAWIVAEGAIEDECRQY